MATVHPILLEGTARLLGHRTMRKPTAAALALLTRTPLPEGSRERAAARAPTSAYPHADVSPLVVRFEDATVAAGPLAGGTVVVKDSLDVRGAASSLGLRDALAPAARDAVVVSRIRAAGGQLIGKTKMTELGMDGLGAFIYGDVPPNPRSPGYYAGGSSTGTAIAVASGLARFGVGGDGMGSVRIPSAFCGLVGLMPTRGRLPSEGYNSPAPSMDVPGPMTRTADDCALLWQVLDGEIPHRLTASSPNRVGIIRELGPERATRSIEFAFRRALRLLEARTVEVTIPGAQHVTLLATSIATGEVSRSDYARGYLSPAGRLNVSLGGSTSREGTLRLEAKRARLRDATLRALERVPVLAMPTTAVPAPAVSRALCSGGQDVPLLLAVAAYTPLANLTGLPSISVPCGVDAEDRVLSIMFLGAPGSETELLRLALAVEATGAASMRA